MKQQRIYSADGPAYKLGDLPTDCWWNIFDYLNHADILDNIRFIDKNINGIFMQFAEHIEAIHQEIYQKEKWKESPIKNRYFAWILDKKTFNLTHRFLPKLCSSIESELFKSESECNKNRIREFSGYLDKILSNAHHYWEMDTKDSIFTPSIERRIYNITDKISRRVYTIKYQDLLIGPRLLKGIIKENSYKRSYSHDLDYYSYWLAMGIDETDEPCERNISLALKYQKFLYKQGYISQENNDSKLALENIDIYSSWLAYGKDHEGQLCERNISLALKYQKFLYKQGYIRQENNDSKLALKNIDIYSSWLAYGKDHEGQLCERNISLALKYQKFLYKHGYRGLKDNRPQSCFWDIEKYSTWLADGIDGEKQPCEQNISLALEYRKFLHENQNRESYWNISTFSSWLAFGGNNKGQPCERNISLALKYQKFLYKNGYRSNQDNDSQFCLRNIEFYSTWLACGIAQKQQPCERNIGLALKYQKFLCENGYREPLWIDGQVILRDIEKYSTWLATGKDHNEQSCERNIGLALKYWRFLYKRSYRGSADNNQNFCISRIVDYTSNLIDEIYRKKQPSEQDNKLISKNLKFLHKKGLRKGLLEKHADKV